MEDVRTFVLEELQKEYSLKKDGDVDSIDYVAEGYMDSLGLLQFIAQIEDEFSIEFTEEELSSTEFKVVGSLIRMIEAKRENAQ